MRLEPSEFNLLWWRLGLRSRPLELNVPAQGATLAEASTLNARAGDALRRRALLFGDEPAPRVAGLLRAVAAPSTQVDVRWAHTAKAPELRGLVALRGKHGALAMWNGEAVTLRWVRSAVFAEELVTVLGDSPAGVGRSVTTPTELVLAASRDSGGDAARFQRKLVAAGVPRDDARAWHDIVTAPRLRAGQIGASGVDPVRGTTRVPWVVHVLDTDRGRYATYARDGYRTVVGMNADQLVRVVRELHTAAVRAVRNR